MAILGAKDKGVVRKAATKSTYKPYVGTAGVTSNTAAYSQAVIKRYGPAIAQERNYTVTYNPSNNNKSSNRLPSWGNSGGGGGYDAAAAARAEAARQAAAAAAAKKAADKFSYLKRPLKKINDKFIEMRKVLEERGGKVSICL